MSLMLFLLALFAVVALVVWLVRKERHLIAQRDQMFSVCARHENWSYTTNPLYKSKLRVPASLGTRSQWDDTDFEFKFEGGPAAAHWSMRNYPARRRGDDSQQASIPTATWQSTDLGTPRTAAMILPRWQHRLETGRVVGAIENIVSAFVDVVNDTESSESRQAFFRRATELKGTLPGFDETFAVLAGPEAPQGWLDESLQETLLKWPMIDQRRSRSRQFLYARLDQGGLSISFQRPPSASWPFWQQLARLGETLAARLGPCAQR